MPVMWAAAQSSAARPVIKSSGLPRGLGMSSTSRQRMPFWRRPTPRALEKASLAAKRRAKAGVLAAGLALAIGDFPWGSEAVQEAVAVARNGGGEAGYLDQSTPMP